MPADAASSTWPNGASSPARKALGLTKEALAEMVTSGVYGVRWGRGESEPTAIDRTQGWHGR